MIRYSSSSNEIAPDQLRGFFVGWPNPPSPETHLRLLRSSPIVALAHDDASGCVVGFATALTDGVLSAYIPLLEVLPPYRGRGIGTTLVRRLLDQLGGLYMIDVTCDEEVQPFYARLGLKPSRGMVLRRYDCQSGRDRPGAAAGIPYAKPAGIAAAELSRERTDGPGFAVTPEAASRATPEGRSTARACFQCNGSGKLHRSSMTHSAGCIFCSECAGCNGTGAIPGDSTRCPKCRGEGRYHDSSMSHSPDCIFCTDCDTCDCEGWI